MYKMYIINYKDICEFSTPIDTKVVAKSPEDAIMILKNDLGDVKIFSITENPL